MVVDDVEEGGQSPGVSGLDHRARPAVRVDRVRGEESSRRTPSSARRGRPTASPRRGRPLRKARAGDGAPVRVPPASRCRDGSRRRQRCSGCCGPRERGAMAARSTTSLGPCTPSGWSREAGRGARARREAVEVARAGCTPSSCGVVALAAAQARVVVPTIFTSASSFAAHTRNEVAAPTGTAPSQDCQGMPGINCPGVGVNTRGSHANLPPDCGLSNSSRATTFTTQTDNSRSPCLGAGADDCPLGPMSKRAKSLPWSVFLSCSRFS